MSKGFITGTNEELIKAYKESRDESYLKELIEANKGLINLLVSPYLTSICVAYNKSTRYRRQNSPVS